MKTRPESLAVIALLAFSLVVGNAATVAVCNKEGLRAALASGSPITFSCNGTITLESPLVVTGEMVIDGAGHDVVLSGAGGHRVFEVAAGGNLTLSNLTIANGRSTEGGGVRNEGTLRAVNCQFADCVASGVAADPSTQPPTAGTPGEGGSVWNSGSATFTGCQFLRNRVTGGAGPTAVTAPDGRITFVPGAYAGQGGAIQNQGQLIVVSCLFSNNTVEGGKGNAALSSPVVAAGRGGTGYGGAIFNETTAVIQQSLLVGNGAYGGEAGGDGFGGAICNGGRLHATNNTVCNNEALGAPGGNADFGRGYGGGMGTFSGAVDIAFCTLTYNYAGGSEPFGAAIYSASNAVTRATHSIVAYANPFAYVPPTNVTGPLIDLGYNLGSQAGATFSGPGSLNGIDPQLGQLVNNGGRWPTMAPRKGSAAVDAGAELGGPSVDQREFTRPFGARLDLGAVEGAVSPPAEPFPFIPSTLVVGQVSYLTLPITNSNRGPLDNISVTYYPPQNVLIPPDVPFQSDCGVPVSPQVVLSGLNLAPGQGCVVRLPVRSDLLGVWTGEYLIVQSDQTGYQSTQGRQQVTVIGAPQGQTEPISGATLQSATLHGRVNPGGRDALVYFQYGLTTNFGQVTPTQTLTAGLLDVPISAEITGLAPSTAFSFQLVASNSFGVLHANTQSGYTLGDTVVVCDESNLALNVARGGQIRFGCSGRINLSAPLLISTNTVIDADGHQVTLSGSNRVQIFRVIPGSRLTLRGLTLASGRSPQGGAVLNEGDFEASACFFTENQALGAATSSGEGGALWNSGTSTLRQCSFTGNSAVGGTGGLTQTNTGKGGAFYNRGSMLITNCLCSGNRAVGGVGEVPDFFISQPGAEGLGGALFNVQSAVVANSTMTGNIALGGQGGPANDFSAGGNGGSGFGGAAYNVGALSVINCTLWDNRAVGGSGTFGRAGTGRDGQGFGGGLVQAGGTAEVLFCTLAGNRSTNGGGALHTRGSTAIKLTASILAQTSSVPNFAGAGSIEDGGYNLSSDASVTFSGPGSITSIDPRLGLLSDNGGPTPTVPLFAGSPAIDAVVAPVSIAIDQRGYPRPAGLRSDIGAYEGSLTTPVLALAFNPGTAMQGSVVSLEIRVENPNPSPLTRIRLTNLFSANLRLAAEPVTSVGFNGVVIATPGGEGVVLSEFSLAPASSCLVRVPVVAEKVGLANARVPAIALEQYGEYPIALTVPLPVSGAPGTDTGNVTAADLTSAVLHGAVNPGGANSVVWFEYGSTPTFGQATPGQPLPTGLESVPVIAAVSGLPSSSDFFFRVGASNQFGVSYGATQTFFTLGSVAICDQAHLSANLAHGGNVRITCSGTIRLTDTLVVSTNLVIEALGQSVTLDGGNAVRVLDITAGGSLTLRGVTISGGRSNHGAGIRNSGNLILEHCQLIENHAVGQMGTAGPNGASAPPHPPAPPMSGSPGGTGGAGEDALGGALYNEGQCLVLETTIANNSATGGTGGTGGNAGSPNYSSGIVTPGGDGGRGGAGLGGGIHSVGTLILSNSTVDQNRVVGGAGGVGGRNYGFGSASGGAGGSAGGAGIRSDYQLALVNVTMTENEATGGPNGGNVGSNGPRAGDAVGGGIDVRQTAALTNCTLAFNRVLDGASSTNSPSLRGMVTGGNLFSTQAVVVLKNVLLAHAPSQVNCAGPIVDAGNNLSSDNSSPFPAASSRPLVDPDLGPLSDNGGSTRTMALRPRSAAIDAGDSAACPLVDQRGRPRPALAGCDIGAYEVQPDFFGLRSIRRDAEIVRLQGIGLPGAAYRVLTSSELTTWQPTGVGGVVGPAGLFEVDLLAGGNSRFFKTVSP